MEVREEVPLSSMTTFRVGGVARRLWVPRGQSETSTLLSSGKLSELRIIGGGSNLLINDKTEFEDVVSAKMVDTRFESIGDGAFYIGASIPIRTAILKVNECGYGGFEELFCLPAQFGGCVAMNAGIGGRGCQLFSVSDFVLSVRVCRFGDGRIEDVPARECGFGYRQSVFQQGGCVILGAVLRCTPQAKAVSEARIEERRAWVKKNQEWGQGCFGSCFSKYSPRILSLCRAVVPKKSTVRVSKTNANWLINDGGGTFQDAKRIIDRCVIAHRVARKPVELEVRLWE